MMHLKLCQQATKANRGKVMVSTEQSRETFNKRFLKFMKAKHSYLPADELKTICSIYDNGITFWVNPNEVGNYNQLAADNTPL